MKRLALAMIMVTLLPGPAPAQMTCRPNSLGTATCIGIPSATSRVGPAFPPSRRGLAGVQERPGAGASESRLVPGYRNDIFGTTTLTRQDLPPRRTLDGVEPPRRCTTDALGNQICG